MKSCSKCRVPFIWACNLSYSSIPFSLQLTLNQFLIGYSQRTSSKRRTTNQIGRVRKIDDCSANMNQQRYSYNACVTNKYPQNKPKYYRTKTADDITTEDMNAPQSPYLYLLNDFELFVTVSSLKWIELSFRLSLISWRNPNVFIWDLNLFNMLHPPSEGMKNFDYWRKSIKCVLC